MYELDPESIDRLDDSKKHELLDWLRELVVYVENSLGVPSSPIRPDPVMDQIIGGLKSKQRMAYKQPSKPGWMSVGFGKCDDKHI